MRIEEEQVNAFVTTAYCDCDEPLKFVYEERDPHVFVHVCVECKKFFELGNQYPIFLI